MLHRTVDEYEVTLKKRNGQIELFEQDKVALRVTLQREFQLKEN